MTYLGYVPGAGLVPYSWYSSPWYGSVLGSLAVQQQRQAYLMNAYGIWRDPLTLGYWAKPPRRRHVRVPGKPNIKLRANWALGARLWEGIV